MATSELGDAAPAPAADGLPAAASVVVPAVLPTVMPWWLPILRAIVALAAALVITFTGGHSAQFGLIALTAWLGATAIVDLVGWRVLPKTLARTASFGRGVVGLFGTLLAGLAAVGAFGPMLDVERAAVLGLTAAATLLIIGMFEAGVGVKTKGLDAYSRDWSTAGVIQIVAAIAIMVVPPGFEHRYQVEDVDGLLTGAIIMIGLLGLTAAVLGVLLVIAGISLRSAARSSVALPAGEVPAADAAAGGTAAADAVIADEIDGETDGAGRS